MKTPPKETLRSGVIPQPPPIPNTKRQTSNADRTVIAIGIGLALLLVGFYVPGTSRPVVIPVAPANEEPAEAAASVAPRSPPSDSPPAPTFMERWESAKREIEAKNKLMDAEREPFITWLKENTAVTDAHFNSNSSLFVSLKPEKYTTPDHVSEIAKTISRWWAQRTGHSYINTHVYLNGSEYASGSHGGLMSR
jgi:hypothetical protein